ncbi:MAG TPA: MlaD family protein [Verrucomicrobiae bacterium]|nr:MlaD family protein [Verrucomicrobiae bacterium]
MEKSSPVPEARVVTKKRGRFSFVWIIPIVAALVGAWIGINTIRNQGPTITIVFKSAEGLDANKTTIRYNGVEVGEISDIRLSDDYQTVIATAKMSPKTEKFLRKDTEFWVVKPQISGGNISGLSTIISGAYIGMEIGRRMSVICNQIIRILINKYKVFRTTRPLLGTSRRIPLY